MSDAELLLPVIWAGFIGASVTLYVLLDGFSLGLGILYPYLKNDHQRDLAMASAAPVWDGNQTWLVGGGAALFCAFPRAFNLLLGALYLPMCVMLVALLFRGVSFEFRFKSKSIGFFAKPFWDKSFAAGSTIAALCQGLILGTAVQGFRLEGEHNLISTAGVLSPFSLFCAFAVVVAYALLACCWLIIKTEDDLRELAIKRARLLLIIVAANILIVSVWTAIAIPAVSERWFSGINIILLSPIPVWSAGITLVMDWLLRGGERIAGRNEYRPFACCIALYLLTLSGLAVSMWPNIVPGVYSMWQVAAPTNSLLFTLVGVLIIVPVILLYTAHAYYVFRGKVNLEDAYH